MLQSIGTMQRGWSSQLSVGGVIDETRGLKNSSLTTVTPQQRPMHATRTAPELTPSAMNCRIGTYVIPTETVPRRTVSAATSRSSMVGALAGVRRGSDSWLALLGDARARWREGGAAVDVRAQRLALGATSLHVANHVVRDEVKLGLELPADPLRLRATGRSGLIEALNDGTNRRIQGDAAVVLPLSWRVEVSVQYHGLGYERATRAGYSAPRRVDAIESGTYWELGGDGAVSLSLDLGGGVQRLADQCAAVGPWKPRSADGRCSPWI